MESFGNRMALGYGGLLVGVWLVALGMEQNGADHSSNEVWNFVSMLRWILSAPIPIAAIVWWLASNKAERPMPSPGVAGGTAEIPPTEPVMMVEAPAATLEALAEETTPNEILAAHEPTPHEARKFTNASEAAASALEELL